MDSDSHLQRIRAKLGRRETLSGNDLRSLDYLHDLLCGDSESDGNGDIGDRSREGPDPGSRSRFPDYLDRSLLDGREGNDPSPGNLPRVVRYVGMVQDMLDPEYYQACDSQGRSAHFGDFYEHEPTMDHNSTHIATADDDDDDPDTNRFGEEVDGNGNGNGHGHGLSCNSSGGPLLAERIPLVVVPIPFASDWLQLRCREPSGGGHRVPPGGTGTQPTVVSPVSSYRGDRKRDRAVDLDHGGNDAEGSGSGPADPRVETEQGNRIRARGATAGTAMATATATTMSIASPDHPAPNPATDWWPAGTCGTAEDHCPVLAKICYDQLHRATTPRGETETTTEQQQRDSADSDADADAHDSSHHRHRSRPLMLNDVVSMVGVLSIHPFDADFSGQQQREGEREGDEPGFWDGGCYGSVSVPPPSRLPRLHVLSYRKVELDDLARVAIRRTKPNRGGSGSGGDLRGEREEPDNADMYPDGDNDNGNDNDSENDSDGDSEVEWSGFPQEEEPSSSSSISVPPALVSLLQDGPWRSQGSEPSWIRALWMCLLSRADRKRSDPESLPEMVRAGPTERALGCLSLRLATPDGASAKALYQRLAGTILPELCPVVATVDLGTWNVSTTSTANSASFLPRKDENGRLNPCLLQLPKGSVLLIHCPPYCSTREKNNDTNRSGFRNGESGVGGDNREEEESVLAAIHELVQHHRVPYRFEGGVRIPFEADYRIILVTTQTRAFPCTLSAVTGSVCSSAMVTDDEPSPPPAKGSAGPELRELLVNGRSAMRNHCSLQFSTPLLERAQKDFLKRRRRYYESPESESSTLPGEDDFHRWLTLTKLETKNRRSRGVDSGEGGGEPSVQDWEAALQLDDELRQTV